MQADSHVVPLRRSGTRLPLFCVHAGGGDVLAYRDMTGVLPDDQPVYGFRPPKQNGASGFLTVEQLSAIYLHDLRQIQGHGPYQLCGQSFGGLVAYEMARLLVNQGEEVRLLALFDTHHPAYCRNLSLTGLLKFRFTYMVNRLNKYTFNVINGNIDRINYDISQLSRNIIRRLTWVLSPRLFHTSNLSLSTIMHNDALLFSAAWRAYIPKVYPNRLILLRAKSRPAEYSNDATLGWNACVLSEIDVNIVEGDHVTMMQLPNVRSLVDALIPYLAGAVIHEPSPIAPTADVK